MPTEQRFYRAMSATEYSVHRLNEAVQPGQQWSDGSPAQYPLSALKNWTDCGHSGGITSGSIDVVVFVYARPGEFRLKTYGDQLARPEDTTPMIPERFINTVPIAFERLRVVYDPRSRAVIGGCRDLEKLV